MTAHQPGTPPDPPPPGGDTPGAAVAGLAREVEAVRRRLDQLQSLPTRVEQLADLLARHAETLADTPPSSPATPATPSWLDLPAHPGRSAESSTAARVPEELLTTLVGWVSGIYLRYLDGAQTLPECWLWHSEIVEELLWLRTAWLAAYRPTAAGTAVGDWHDRQRPGVVRRVRDYAGLCSLEQHQPGHERHAPAPVAPLADAVPAIAAWWATHPSDPPPAPTAEQLAAAHRWTPQRSRR